MLNYHCIQCVSISLQNYQANIINEKILKNCTIQSITVLSLTDIKKQDLILSFVFDTIIQKRHFLIEHFDNYLGLLFMRPHQ